MCGFKFAGDCRDFTPAFPSPFACAEFGPDDFTDHGSFYSACHTCAGLGTWPNCDEFDKVITIFVTP